jgi:hypothetical protein
MHTMEVLGTFTSTRYFRMYAYRVLVYTEVYTISIHDIHLYTESDKFPDVTMFDLKGCGEQSRDGTCDADSLRIERVWWSGRIERVWWSGTCLVVTVTEEVQTIHSTISIECVFVQDQALKPQLEPCRVS